MFLRLHLCKKYIVPEVVLKEKNNYRIIKKQNLLFHVCPLGTIPSSCFFCLTK